MDLNHALIPFRKRAVYLRLVNTRDKAKDYAAGGFHVSVDRGLAGGCRDSSRDFSSGGTRVGVCTLPMNRQDVAQAWANAATAYGVAWDAAHTTMPLDGVKALLLQANALADAAYRLEGVAPPVDPVRAAQSGGNLTPAMTEPAAAPAGSVWAFVASLAVTAAGVTATAFASR